MDNASTNDVLARTLTGLLLEKYGIHFSPENGQIRCLAHVVNLVVQKILASIIDAEDPDENDWYLLHKFLPFHYDLEDDDELNAMEEEEAAAMDEKLADLCSDEDKDTPISDEEILNAVQKLRLIVRKIVSSPQRRSSFRKHAVRHYEGKPNPTGGKPLTTLMPVRDVRTRWNCTHAMIEPLTLFPEDWNFLQQLANLLSHFTHVTHIMSKQSMPTLPWVLPMYAHMKTALTDTITSPSTKPMLAVAAQAGLSKLEQYYTKARECQYNVVATVCHPNLRVNWFSKLGSEEKLRAEALFEHVFHEYEKKLPKATDAPARPAPVATPASFLDLLSADVPDPEAQDGADVQDSEVVRWLRFEGGRGNPHDPLGWWKVCSSVAV
ncbi:ribonuclease H-like domain-containing protein [Fomitopsis serialis]|uniref:ribonuclease H-like domain-containing protein n=1 Tax=Fomitopsis serialis TaxID=139415 RepID=UPI0020086C6B|nr:ribonuclease H-like domain-containing protein [Neoantrodia serialis]KAH9912012.1 ribonuclease H-like domain-containing protein [Neoantrodia serialis]